MKIVDKNLEKKNYKNTYQLVINKNCVKQNQCLQLTQRKKQKDQKARIRKN